MLVHRQDAGAHLTPWLYIEIDSILALQILIRVLEVRRMHRVQVLSRRIPAARDRMALMTMLNLKTNQLFCQKILQLLKFLRIRTWYESQHLIPVECSIAFTIFYLPKYTFQASKTPDYSDGSANSIPPITIS